MATQAQLAQYALNLSNAVQQQLINGQQEPGSKGPLVALAGACVLLAESILNAGGGTIPGSLTTGKYSAPVSPTAPIQT